MTPARRRVLRLALALGRTAREVERLPWKEFSEWEIFLASHPPPAEVIDWQFATLLSVLASALGAPSHARRIESWSVYDRMRPRTDAEVADDIKRQFGVGG